MENTPNSQRSRVMTISFIVVAVIIGYILGSKGHYSFFNMHDDDDVGTGMTACTMEAMICPDGSSVGRQ